MLAIAALLLVTTRRRCPRISRARWPGRYPHRDVGTEHGVALRVGDHDGRRQVVALIGFDRRDVRRRHGAHRANGLLHVFDPHAFRDPAHGGRNGCVGHQARGEFSEVAQRDRVHRAEVVGDLATMADRGLAASRLEHADAWRDAGEVGRLPAHRAREQPLARGPARDAAIQGEHRAGHRCHLQKCQRRPRPPLATASHRAGITPRRVRPRCHAHGRNRPNAVPTVRSRRR